MAEAFLRNDGAPDKARSIVDCVAEALLRNTGLASELKSNVDRISEALCEALNEHARTHGISLQEAFNLMCRQSEDSARKRRRMPLPAEFNQRKGDSHSSWGSEVGL